MNGFAGAVRINRLTIGQVEGQELHGKRLDKSSLARKVSDDPPMTTTGLDLVELLEAHEQGAARQGGAQKRAIHMIVQFPKELVDGEDGDLMLRHARSFAESVFGPDAVFADRLDRDEFSRHVVDLFIAPRYVKKTKKSETTKISLSHHLKSLAKRREELNKSGEPDLRSQGRALQGEFHDYLVNEMGLDQAMRGTAKMYGDSDWQTPEQVKAKALAEKLAEQVKNDVAAIVAEAPILFEPNPRFPGQLMIADEHHDRAMALTELVGTDSFFEIGKAVLSAKIELTEQEIEARKGELLSQVQVGPDEIQREKSRMIADVKLSQDEVDRRKAALLAEIKLTDQDRANRRSELLRQVELTDQEIQHSRAVAKNLEAEWRKTNAAGAAEVDRLKAEVAKERQAAAADKAAAEKDREAAKSERMAAAAVREGLTVALDAVDRGEIIDARGGADTAKQMVYAPGIAPARKLELQTKIAPALDWVWQFVKDRAARLTKLVEKEREVDGKWTEAGRLIESTMAARKVASERYKSMVEMLKKLPAPQQAAPEVVTARKAIEQTQQVQQQEDDGFDAVMAAWLKQGGRSR